ncbi:MAG: vanadium-dependent haloperoxidase [Gammaproteobacteria bacterium]
MQAMCRNSRGIVACLVLGLVGCSSAENAEPRESGHTLQASGDAEAGSDQVDADPAIEWNREIIKLAKAEDGLLTLKGVRTAVMAHLAMHDALNAVRPVYASYACDTAAADADPVIAAVQAAFEVVVSQYPDRRPELDRMREKQLLTISDGAGRAAGIALGKACAAAILERRNNDGWNTEVAYEFHPMGPGVYAEFREHSGTPQGFVFGAGWAKARPFVLTSADQFRAPPPPEIDSREYLDAYNEVKTTGRIESRTRSADQTHLALWWKDFAENSMNKLARELTNAETMDLWTASRLFALINAAIYDGYVSVFENKYFYNHWRPYTAIRWAEHDGNPDTVADPDWNNTHGHTYAFPSYPSAHGTVCAAALTIFTKTFGDGYPFTMTTEVVDSAGPMSPKMKMDPPTRSFESFSAAARECALSRVYLGIHFRYDSTEGTRLGERIGNYVWENSLRPVHARTDSQRTGATHSLRTDPGRSGRQPVIYTRKVTVVRQR